MLLDERAATSTVLIDSGSDTHVTVGDILAEAQLLHDALGGSGQVAFLLCDGSISSYRLFLALLEAKVPVALIDPALERSRLTRLLEAYAPVAVVDPARPGRIPASPASGSDSVGELHPELAVLLSTSGSTGSAKLVRLSSGNVRSNAEQIVISLGIRATDRAVTALPLHYSYGMSVVTSHALAGSPIVVNPFSVLQREFWDVMREQAVTVLPGVPQTYAMLHRLHLPPNDLPALRAMTQAGGRLASPLVTHFSEVMDAYGGQFFVMYGQTEAGPRIACLPPERLPENPGSAGLALAGGRLDVLDVLDADVLVPPGAVGEVVYSGPNVMMGYGESRRDLALGDMQGSTLRTGDLGYLDEEGFLFLTGRHKRIAKLAGARISLDEVEAMAVKLTPVVAVDAGDAGVTLFTTIADEDPRSATRRDLAHRLHVPPKLIRVDHVDDFPLLGNGKVDYRTLTHWAQEGRG